MGYKIQVSDTAESNIDGILVYMLDTLKSPGTAVGFLDDLKRTYEYLEESPYIYSVCKDAFLARQGYRSAVIKSYLIFYQIEEDVKVVKIVAVIYGGRDYAKLISAENET
ncbi:MAG: type II toxin-antitoxin system RelE/ParE family toxin [Oscillospiraceae bacterium]|jgi:plasmid stabilization system protein ParE|nr:type II toxin-antitoxin system RelE/ParE family toxin [Oscillospiraceae bacterium]